MDENTVQPGATSTTQPTGDASKQVQAPAVLDEAKVEELLNKRMADYDAKHQATIRELQSVKDRSIAELERRARQAETTYGTLKSRIAQAAPDLAPSLEVDELRAQLTARQEAEQQSRYQAALQQRDTSFREQMQEFAKSAGVDPSDKEITAALESASKTGDYWASQKKVLDRVAKATGDKVKEVETKFQKEINKLKADFGVVVDSVDTSTSGATPAGIPTSRKALAAYVDKLSEKEFLEKQEDIMAARLKLKD
jgi:hypothetical protein